MLHLDMNCIHGHTSLNKDCLTDSLNYVKNNLAVVHKWYYVVTWSGPKGN